jgi:hypothetical protein
MGFGTAEFQKGVLVEKIAGEEKWVVQAARPAFFTGSRKTIDFVQSKEE